MADININLNVQIDVLVANIKQLTVQLGESRNMANDFKKSAISAGEEASKAQKKAGEAAAQTTKTLADMQRQYKSLLDAAVNAGALQTEAGRRQLKEAGELKMKIDEITKATENYASKTPLLDATTSAFDVVTASAEGFAAAQNLLGANSENTKAILEKLSAAAEIYGGIQKAITAFERDGAIVTALKNAQMAIAAVRTQVLSRLTQQNTAVTAANTTAAIAQEEATVAVGIATKVVGVIMKVFAIDAAAAWAVATFGISLLITAIIAAIAYFKDLSFSGRNYGKELEDINSKHDKINTTLERQKAILEASNKSTRDVQEELLKNSLAKEQAALKVMQDQADEKLNSWWSEVKFVLFHDTSAFFIDEETAKKIAEQKQKVDDIKNELTVLGVSTDTLTDQIKNKTKLDLLSVMLDSKAKEIAIINETRRQEKEALEKRLGDITDLKARADAIKAFNKVTAKQIDDVNRKYAEKQREYLQQVADFRLKVLKEAEIFESPEQRIETERKIALAGLKVTQEQLARENKKALEEGVITRNKYNEIQAERERQFTTLKLAIAENYNRQQLELQKQQQADLLALQDDGREKEIAQVEQRLNETLEKYKTFGVATAEVDALHVAAADKAQKDIDAINQKYNLQSLDYQQEHQKSLVDLQQRSGMSEVAFERYKETEKLKIDIEFAKKKLALLQSALVDAPQSEQQNIQKQIDDLQSTIADGQKKLAALGEQTEKFSLARALFGNATDGEGNPLTDAEFAAIDEDLQTMLNSAVSAITDAIDFQISKNQELIDSIKKRIEAQEDVVKKEEELQKKGLANNVKTEKERLKQLQKQQEDAVAKQKKLAKEKAAIDAVTQAVSLVTASAQIIQSLSSAGPIGVAIAAVTIAAMVGAFIASRIKISQTVGQGYYKGGYTGDGSATDEAGVVHKREFVFTADDTKKHRHLFEGIHNNDNAKIQAGILDLLNDTGIALPETGVVERLRIVHDNAKAQRTASANELAGLRGDVQAIAERMDAMAGKQREQVINTQNDTFIKKGLKTTRLR